MILACAAVAVAQGGPVINEYSTPTQPSSPVDIVAGPDGALWFTEQAVNANGAYQIGRITTDGAFTEYPIPPISIAGTPSYPEPQGIAAGPDGALWFTGLATTTIGRITTSGAITEYAVPSGGNPQWIVQGPDGALWFTEQAFGSAPAAIGRITTTGAFTEFPIPAAFAGSNPFGIAAGPDGALWFADPGINSIGRITTAGAITEYGVPTAAASPWDIIAGPDGALWFTEIGASQIGRITTAGVVTAEYPTPTPFNSPYGIALGSDGALWFTEASFSPSQLGRITTTGAITEYQTPTQPSYPEGIALGPDGALWFAENLSNSIGQLLPTLSVSCNFTTAEVGAMYSATCAGAGGTPPYTFSITAGALPPGLTLNTTTGAVTGVPSSAGTFSFTVTIADSASHSASQQITNFVVTPRTALTLSCSFTSTAQVSVAFSSACTASGSIPPYTYSITAGALPPGLSLNSSTGAITGTPTTYGTFSFTVQAKDSGVPPLTTTQQVTNFTVLPAPLAMTCNFSAGLEVGINYLSVCGATGGIPPYSYSVLGSLPPGLNLNTSTGVISGTPTTPGTFTFTVQVSDRESPRKTATQPATLTVVSPPLALECNFSIVAKVGVSYSTTCVAANGTSPYTFAISAGALPPGLTLGSTTGSVTGTPTSAGIFSFTVRVADSSSPAATARQAVNAFLVQPATVAILTTTLPNGSVQLPYAATPLVGGGVGPYSWSIQTGGLPTGLSLNHTTGAITGTPNAAGSFAFTLHVTDSSGTPQSATQSFTVTISGAIAPDFAEYAIASGTGADGVTTGPDAAVWFTEADQPAGNEIGRITTAGSVTNTYPAPNPLNSVPTGGNIVLGPNGALWFTETDADRIGEISAAGQTIDFPVPSAGSRPQQIAAGADGALWFTEQHGSNIGRITTAGVVIEFPTPTVGSAPSGIALGRDGAMWFTENAANQIGRITSAGTITEYPISTAGAGPLGIVAGPDGALWFTENAAGKIGRISTTGVVTEFATPTAASGPGAITHGVDGALWFTEFAANQIGRITTAGVITEYAIPTAASGPRGITLGPDGALWFAEDAASAIGRFNLVQKLGLTCSLPGTVQAGATYSGSCTASAGAPPYTYSISAGTLPAGLNLNASTGAVTGVPTAPGTFSFTVQATDSALPAETATKSVTLTITPQPLSLSCSLSSATVGVAYSSGCTAVGGTPPYSYSLTSGSLPGGLTLDGSTGAITGTALAPGAFSGTIQVSDSASPPAVATATFSIVVMFGTTTGTGQPLFTLTAVPSTASPGQNIAGASIQLNQAVNVPLTATLTLGFTPNATAVPSGYIDPAVQFLGSNGAKLGTTFSVTFPANATSVPIPEIDPGTVAGAITVTLSLNNLSEAVSTITMDRLAPVIEAGSVQILNVTSTGFDVEVVANSTPRDLSYATFTFTSAQGTQIIGDTSFTFNVKSLLDTWYSSAEGLSYGSAFSLTVPFTLSGPASAIQSVSVTLTNSVGASAAVSGTQ